MSPRLIASQIIEHCIENKMTLSLALNSNDSFKSAGKDKALIQEMTYGTFRWYFQLEEILNRLLDKKIKKKDRLLKYLILIGLYQLRFMRIPQHAAVSETVNTCKSINMNWAKGLVNAILRRYIRELDSINLAFEKHINLKTSHPKWLVHQFEQDWPKHFQSILEANNQKPPMYLRVNQIKQNRDDYLKQLNHEGIKALATEYSIDGILLEDAIDVQLLPYFKEGHVSVQELAAQFSASLLHLKPGLKVLDAYAAPGGKSAHILESEPNLESLISVDKESKRIEKLTDTLDRLNLKATIKCADINDLMNWWNGNKFDRILLDAPCSATGVIRRHPDIKFLRSKEEVEHINSLQKSLLSNLWKTLEAGGLLLYVTCSILKQENMNIIKTFIAENDDCQLKPINVDWGIDTGYGRQILPGKENMDGFFYAQLKKK